MAEERRVMRALSRWPSQGPERKLDIVARPVVDHPYQPETSQSTVGSGAASTVANTDGITPAKSSSSIDKPNADALVLAAQQEANKSHSKPVFQIPQVNQTLGSASSPAPMAAPRNTTSSLASGYANSSSSAAAVPSPAVTFAAAPAAAPTNIAPQTPFTRTSRKFQTHILASHGPLPAAPRSVVPHKELPAIPSASAATSSSNTTASPMPIPTPVPHVPAVSSSGTHPSPRKGTTSSTSPRARSTSTVPSGASSSSSPAVHAHHGTSSAAHPQLYSTGTATKLTASYHSHSHADSSTGSSKHGVHHTGSAPLTGVTPAVQSSSAASSSSPLFSKLLRRTPKDPEKSNNSNSRSESPTTATRPQPLSNSSSAVHTMASSPAAAGTNVGGLSLSSASNESMLKNSLMSPKASYQLDSPLWTVLSLLIMHVDEGEEGTPRAMVSLLEARGQTVDFLNTAITKEIAQTKSSSTLFRSNSPATKLISCYFVETGIDFVRPTLSNIVQAICANPQSWELDESKLDRSQKASDVSVNLTRVVQQVRGLLDGLSRIAASCPRNLKDILQHTRESAAAAFPRDGNMGLIAVGALFFLRFVCPAIVTPEKYGIVADAPSPSARRGLILVSKVMQNLANQMEFDGSKEAYMSKLNEFMKSNFDTMKTLCEKLSDTGARGKERRPIAMFPSLSSTDAINAAIKTIVRELHRHSEDAKGFFQQVPSQNIVRMLVQELHSKYPESTSSLDQLLELGRVVSPRPPLQSEALTLKKLQDEVQQLKQQLEEERALTASLRRKLGEDGGLLPVQARERSGSVTTDTSSTDEPSDVSSLSSSTLLSNQSADERREEKKRKKKEKHSLVRPRRSSNSGESPPKTSAGDRSSNSGSSGASSALKKLVSGV